MKNSLFLSTMAMALTWVPAAEASPTTNAGTSTQQFAACAVRNYDGAEMLATEPGSVEESEVVAEYARKGCAAPSNDMPLLRGAVAEQLFKHDFGTVGARPKRDSIEVFSFDDATIASLDPATQKRVYLTSFGSCVAAADSTRAAAFLQTAAGSAEETRAVSELTPGLSPCLNEGERLNLGKTELRGLVAEGIYRMALARSMDETIIVTGTRDDSKSVTCKNLMITGTLMKRQVCLTEAQWKSHDLQEFYKKQELERRADLYNAMKTLCISQQTRGDGGGGPCLIR
jgi:hypothetical protein